MVQSDSFESERILGSHYTHGVCAGNLLFCSARRRANPGTALSPGDVASQTADALRELEALCEARDTSLANATRISVYLAGLADLAEAIDGYRAFFADTPPPPPRFQATGLPDGDRVSIDAVVPSSDRT